MSPTSSMMDKCDENPLAMPGGFVGHVYPGMAMAFLGLAGYWIILSRYFKSIAMESTYIFDGRLGTRLAIPGIPKLPIGVIGICAALGVYIGNVPYQHFGWGRTWMDAVLETLGDPHSPIIYAILGYSVVSLLEHFRPQRFPENGSQLAFTFVWGIVTSVAYRHLVARCPYDVEMHTISLYLPAQMTVACLALQMLIPSSFLLAAGACFSMLMAGLGVTMIGILGFTLQDSAWWMNLSLAEKTRRIPLYFFNIAGVVFVALVVIFVAFDEIRGRRLGADNPDYMVDRSNKRQQVNNNKKNCGYEEESPLLFAKSIV